MGVMLNSEESKVEAIVKSTLQYVRKTHWLPVPHDYVEPMLELNEKFKSDALLNGRKSEITRNFLSEYWAYRCQKASGMREFLTSIRDGDKKKIGVYYTGKLLMLRPGKDNFLAEEKTDFLPCQKFVKEMTGKLNGILFQGIPLRFTSVMISPDMVKFDAVKDEPIPMTLVVGRTGTGKSSVARYMATVLGCPQVRSYATRPMRAGEAEKSDHIFIKPEEVMKYKDEMSAYTRIGEFEYFTTWSILEQCRHGIYVIDPRGVHDLRNSIRDAGKTFDLKVVYVHVNDDVRLARLRERGDSPEVAKKRMEAEEEQFRSFEQDILTGKEPNVFVLDNSGDFTDTTKVIVENLAAIN